MPVRAQPPLPEPSAGAAGGEPEVAEALRRSLRGYLDHLTVERGSAHNTLLSYRRDLDRYLCSLAAQGVDDVTGVEPEHIRVHLTGLRRGDADHRPLAPSSAARAVVAVRGWHRFLLAEGATALDPSRDVHPPQAAKRLPKALPIESVLAILDAAVPDGPRGLRDRALLEFLYATGARISEAVGLDLDDLPDPRGLTAGAAGASGAGAAGGAGETAGFSETGGSEETVDTVVRLFGKGRKERLVPLGSYAVQAISAYLVRGRPALVGAGKGSAAVFLNVRGSRLSRQSAWQVLADAAGRAGIDTPVSPHTLRHCFATHLLAGGADVRVVQELLGHASVTTTQIYTLVTVDALREVYALAHPRAR